LIELIHGLARYERSPESVKISAQQLHEALFGEAATVHAHVAEEDGRVVGMAIWFLTFSTWTGHHGIYLEDLYVREDVRGRGVGRALLTELAAVAVRSGYSRIDWSVLTWNEPALAFYLSLGARPQDEWIGYRLTEDTLPKLVQRPDSAVPPPA